MNYCNILVFCWKIGDIGMFVYKKKLFVVIWIATAYNHDWLVRYFNLDFYILVLSKIETNTSK